MAGTLHYFIIIYLKILLFYFLYILFPLYLKFYKNFSVRKEGENYHLPFYSHVETQKLKGNK